MPDIQSLIERVEAGERSNALDVLIEVALFRPDENYASVRANAAGSKVIYRSHIGKETTHLAADWTMFPERALGDLRSRAQQGEG
jgi:hypothetical protein